ncbi:MAG: O-methyltransferase [Tissierellales bacterium]|jgi:predicted O-methyltransferase YrrM|nr:O-methyltransferase [Tissierellales bacterium]
MGKNINKDYIIDYLRTELPRMSGILYDMEKYAEEYNVPIIHPEVAQMIRVFLSMKKPNSILELGTAIGYSSIFMVKMQPSCKKLITIERSEMMIQRAKENIKKAELENIIEIKEGNVQDILPKLDGKFDVIFIDAAKSKYLEFLPYCLDRLSDDGVIISDNVLFKGMIATDMLVPKRQRTIVRKMREYLNVISHHEELETTIIPIGDGVAISHKKGLKGV